MGALRDPSQPSAAATQAALGTIPVAAAAGCDRRQRRREFAGCGRSDVPRALTLRSLRNRTQPSAAATKAALNTIPVAAAAGCDRRQRRREFAGCGRSDVPRALALRSLRNRTQPSATATQVALGTSPLIGGSAAVSSVVAVGDATVNTRVRSPLRRAWSVRSGRPAGCRQTVAPSWAGMSGRSCGRSATSPRPSRTGAWKATVPDGKRQ